MFAADGDAVIGFATVSPSAIDVGRVPAMRRKRSPKYPRPVLRLARLAVDERAQGRGVGRVFLKAVFGLAKDLSQDYGCVGVVVDATPEAITFDQRYGFIEFFGLSGHLGDRPQPRPMFLEIDAIPDSPPNP